MNDELSRARRLRLHRILINEEWFASENIPNCIVWPMLTVLFPMTTADKQWPNQSLALIYVESFNWIVGFFFVCANISWTLIKIRNGRELKLESKSSYQSIKPMFAPVHKPKIEWFLEILGTIRVAQIMANYIVKYEFILKCMSFAICSRALRFIIIMSDTIWKVMASRVRAFTMLQ